MIPWPEAEWRAMQQESLVWRAKRRERPGAGTLFLLDGASCSGKSTLVDRLTNGVGAVDLVPRYSTRERRQDDQRRREYIFVSQDSFRSCAAAGAFIEYRDFLFGMSYGLPWAEAFAPLLDGRQALGVINLGNVEYVKVLLPEAVTILVDASLDTIRRRLVARGVNTTEQIEERLANAARVEDVRGFYDHVVTNEEGGLDEAERILRGLIASRAVTG
jgi:ribose 1,5-bisphosphokinase